MLDTSPLAGVRKLPDYRARRAHIFHSPAALEWFVRRNRQALIDAGALVMLTGQWHAHEAKFDQFVLDVGQAAAHKHRAIA